MSFIKFVNVEHSYQLGKVGIPALRGINLEISKGEIIALVGPSGSGKTTLINLLGTLDTPTQGEIYVDSLPIGNLSPKEKVNYRKNMVSFVFQFFNLFPTLNVFENVEFPLLFSDVSVAEIKERVSSAVEMVGLKGLEKRSIDELSGGQRQRVAVARALVTRAQIVLADEPTGNLDGETAIKVMDLMAEINQKYGTTLIFSTHDPRVMKYAHRICEIKDGVIENIKINKGA
jgi:putative ABC transport system ATP-binding protein